MCCLRTTVVALALLAAGAHSQTVPTFQHRANEAVYEVVGRDPARGQTTNIPVVLVPITLRFASDSDHVLDATGSIPRLLDSPVFTPFRFPRETATQYADAMLRASFQHSDDWHTLFARPNVISTITISIPPQAGYLLTSKRGGALGIADINFIQHELFRRVPKQPGSLLVAVTTNTAFYVEGDATICCTWGTHGADEATGNSFVLASYLSRAPAVVQDQDVQPVTEQIAEFINDPLHDPLVPALKGDSTGNKFPRWLRPPAMRPGDQGPCGGSGVATSYFLLEPTDINRKNNLPQSKPFTMTNGTSTYHVQNVALLPWYLRSGRIFSFPDVSALPEPAKACPNTISAPRVSSAPPASGPRNGHSLIGYWTGSDSGRTLPLHAVSPSWDVVIIAFAVPDPQAPEGTLKFQPPNATTTEELKAAIASLHRSGRKVLLSLGGGGQFFTLDQPASIPVFVSCLSRIVREYGFDGIDLDFETPSLILATGDTDFRRPTTPGILHIIAALKQLRAQLGPAFLISLVPEGPQMVGGHVTYGGQFGSYLPIAYGIRDILTFVDVQDYNTPPLEGLDGEIYQAGTIDYHAAATELLLQGFPIRGGTLSYPAIAQGHVAVGFYVEETDVPTVSASIRYLIEGRRPPGGLYSLLQSSGYPQMLGAMFWNIDEDWSSGYAFSNVVGPLLHSFATHPAR